MRKNFRILSLDDDRLIRTVMKDIFSGEYESRTASDLDEFNYILSDFDPDIIFLDIEMPGANGIEICRMLKKTKKRAHIIMMSGLDKPETVQSAYEAGADDYIRKPFLPFEVIAKVEMIFKNMSYSSNIQKLLSQQKQMTESIFSIARTINRNVKITQRMDLFSTIIKVMQYFHCDYVGLLLDNGDTEKIMEKSFNQGFHHVPCSKLEETMKIFHDDSLLQETAKLKVHDRCIRCYIKKIFFNEKKAGFLVVQNSSEMDTHVVNLIALYLDFVNLKGRDITKDQLLKAELKKERTEIEKVRNLQVTLLPDFHEVEKFDVASTFIPMEELSGDFFDGFYVSEDIYQIIVCDVSGHGIASSYVGSSIRGILRSTNASGKKASEIIESLNSNMYRSFQGVYYFSSLVFCQLNVKTGEMVIVSAGHPPCFYYEKEADSYLAVENTGPLVGLMENAEFQQHEFTMNNGDIMLIYTDGLSEASPSGSNSLYGEDNILESFKRDEKANSVEIVHSVVNGVYEYIGYGAFDDDLTILCIKRGL